MAKVLHHLLTQTAVLGCNCHVCWMIFDVEKVLHAEVEKSPCAALKGKKKVYREKLINYQE